MNLDTLRKFFALDGVTTRPAYKPKFCRTRGCNLKFEHEGDCGTVAGERVAFADRRTSEGGRRRPREGRAVKSGRRVGRVTVHYAPLKSPKAAPIPGAADRMAHYRRRPVNVRKSS